MNDADPGGTGRSLVNIDTDDSAPYRQRIDQFLLMLGAQRGWKVKYGYFRRAKAHGFAMQS